MVNLNKKYGLKGINIKEGTYERLVRRKEYPRQSFDEVINNLMDKDKEVVKK